MYLWLSAGVIAGVALAAVFPSQDLVGGFLKIAPTAALVAIAGYVANYLIKQITQVCVIYALAPAMHDKYLFDQGWHAT